jgi:hypothetical protein
VATATSSHRAVQHDFTSGFDQSVAEPPAFLLRTPNPAFSPPDPRFLRARVAEDTCSALARVRDQNETLTQQDVDVLKLCYLQARRYDGLESLTQRTYSELISFFGTVSSYPNLPTLPFVHPCAGRLPQSAALTREWPLLMQVAGDMEAHGQDSTAADHYWMVRALLLQSSRSASHEGSVVASSPVTTFPRLRHHYGRVYRQVSDPAFHLAYFRFVLSVDDSDLASEVATEGVLSLSQVLDLSGRVDHGEQDIVWAWLLRHQADVHPRAKSLLLSSVSRHVRRGAHLRVDGPRGTPPFKTHGSSPLAPLIDAMNVAAIGHTGNQGREYNVALWAQSTWERILRPERPPEARWKSLCLLGVAVQPTGLSGAALGFSSSDDGDSPRVTDWTVIGVLRALQNMLSAMDPASIPDELIQSVDDMTGSLWNLWTGGANEDRERPMLIERPVLTVFLQLSLFIGSAALGRSCLKRCEKKRAVVGGKKPKLGSETEQWKHLASAWLASAAGDKSGAAHLAALLKESWVTPHLRSTVASTAIKTLLVRNLSSAHDLLSATVDSGTNVGWHTVKPYADAMVSTATVQPVMDLLSTPQRGQFPRRELLFEVMKGCHPSWPADAVQSVAEAIPCVFADAAPLRTMRSSIERNLLLLAEVGRAQQAVGVATQLQKQHPTFLRPTWIMRLLHHAFAQRKYRAAAALFRRATAARPELMAPYRENVVMRLAQGGAHAQARSTDGVTRATNVGGDNPHTAGLSLTADGDNNSTSVLLTLSRMTGHRLRRAPSSPALRAVHALPKLLRELDSAVNPRMVQRLYANTVRACVGAHRVRAAQHVLALAVQDARVDGPTRTALANMVLTATLRPRRQVRNARVVRDGLRRLAAFGPALGAAPDRVTLNVVLRALASWVRGVDAAHLRALFDQLTRHGYPPGPRGVAPFDTTPGARRMPLLEHMTGTPEFKRHVLPLYLTFMRGFRKRGDAYAGMVVQCALEAAGAEYRERRYGRGHKQKHGTP